METYAHHNPKFDRKRASFTDNLKLKNEELAKFKANIKDAVKQEDSQKKMTKKAVRVYMTNPRHRLALTRGTSSAASDLLGYEASCDHL